MNDTLNDGQIAYIPQKGIYRWNAAKGEYDTLYGQDFPKSGETGVIFPIPLNDEILKRLGFQSTGASLVKDNLKIDFDISKLRYTINDKPVEDFNDLHDHMKDHNLDIDFGNLFDLLSGKSKKQ